MIKEFEVTVKPPDTVPLYCPMCGSRHGCSAAADLAAENCGSLGPWRPGHHVCVSCGIVFAIFAIEDGAVLHYFGSREGLAT